MASDTEHSKTATPNDAPAFSIREMELEDLPAVYQMGHEVFTAEEFPNLYRTWDEYELVGMFAGDGEFCLVAEDDEDGRLLGFVLGTIIDKRRSAWTYGYLVWLAVLPEVEGKGVARRLAHRLTELFIEAGARMMLVDTDAANERAIRFFERDGFTNPAEHVYMTKNLTGLAGYRKRRAQARGRDAEPAPHVRPKKRLGQVLPSGQSKKGSK